MKQRLCACVLLLLLGGCSRGDHWTLAFREQASALAWQFGDIAGYYPSLEQCQAKGAGLVRLAGDKGQFLCARQCEADNGLLNCAELAPTHSTAAVSENP